MSDESRKGKGPWRDPEKEAAKARAQEQKLREEQQKRNHVRAAWREDIDLYALLGVKKTATIDEIKRARIKMQTLFHPDRADKHQLNKLIFNKINEAREILEDDAKRAAYDRGENSSQEAQERERLERIKKTMRAILKEYLDGTSKNSLFKRGTAAVDRGVLVNDFLLREKTRYWAYLDPFTVFDSFGRPQTDQEGEKFLQRIQEEIQKIFFYETTRQKAQRSAGNAGARAGARAGSRTYDNPFKDPKKTPEQERKEKAFNRWLEEYLDESDPRALRREVRDILEKGTYSIDDIRQAAARFVDKKVDTILDISAPNERAEAKRRVDDVITKVYEAWLREKRARGDQKSPQEYEDRMNAWLASIEEYAYKELQKGKIYKEVSNAVFAQVNTLSTEEQKKYRARVEKAVVRAFERNRDKKKRAFDGWAQKWFAALPADVEARLTRGDEERKVRADLEKMLNDNLQALVVDETEHHAYRRHMQARVYAAIEKWKREKGAKKETKEASPADAAFDTWATAWTRNDLPKIVRNAVLMDELDEDDIVAVATATLGTKRAAGTLQTTFNKHRMNVEALTRELYREVKKSGTKEEKEGGREKFSKWYQEWMRKVPGMARKVLEKTSADEMHRRAIAVFEKKAGEFGVPKADLDIIRSRLEKVLGSAEMMHAWLNGIPLFVGRRIQAGEKIAEVCAAQEADCTRMLQSVQLSEHEAYHKKLAEILEKVKEAYSETVGKGGDVNDFYQKIFAAK